jgi:hypothetical protein
MLSNMIILFLKSPPHFLLPIPQTHLTTLFAFLTIYLSDMCLIRDFLSSQFHSFSSLFLFLILNTIIFIFLTFTSNFFFLIYFPRFFIISFISLFHSLPQLLSRPQTPVSKLSFDTHHFRLLNIHFQLFLPHIPSQVLHHFFHFSYTLCHNY